MNNAINEKVNALRELRRMADELAAEIDTLQDFIKQHMTVNGLEILNGIDYKITYKTVKSTRFDTTAFKKDNPEIAELYTKTTESKRFTIA